MEITHPDADPSVVWYVTNGLLVVELMSGNLQLGDAAFEPHDPAQINVAGDADDPLGPTYATMALVRDAPPRPNGDVIDERIERDGRIYTDPDLAFHGATVAYRVTLPGIDHQVAAPFWEFMNTSGTIYVGDTALNRIQYFTSEGTFLGQWGTTGTDPSQFDMLTGLAVAWDRIYAADAGNHRVQVFTLSGEFLGAFGSEGDGPGQFRAPTGIALDARGYVYVVDSENATIQKFTPEGTWLATFGGQGDGHGEFTVPLGITIDAAGRVYIGDAALGRVQVFVPVE